MDKPTPKRNYKDSLFCSKFSNPEDPAALHEHINGRPTSPDQITINTLRHALFSQVRNDISFLVGEKFMVLTEEDFEKKLLYTSSPAYPQRLSYLFLLFS